MRAGIAALQVIACYHSRLDNPTHTLVGLMLSRAGLNRWTPRPDLLLTLAANAPDIDAVSWFGGAAYWSQQTQVLREQIEAMQAPPLAL